MEFNKSTIKRIIVISPHADDEVIGCGGMLSMASKSDIEVTVVVMATGGIKHYHLDRTSPTESRILEFKTCAQRLRVSHTKILFPGKDMRLETMTQLELVTALDNVLNEKEYDECYIPEPSHNLDHRITFEVCMASLRPLARKYPRLIATYESATSSWWDQEGRNGQLYVDISSTIDDKLFALEAYQSQLRTYPHPVSKEGIKRMAAYRGMKCGVKYAELFKIIRLLR